MLLKKQMTIGLDRCFEVPEYHYQHYRAACDVGNYHVDAKEFRVLQKLVVVRSYAVGVQQVLNSKYQRIGDIIEYAIKHTRCPVRSYSLVTRIFVTTNMHTVKVQKPRMEVFFLYAFL